MRITHTQQQSRTLQAGFTLVELLVIVAVIGIVSGIGLTTMASFLQEQRLRQAAFELASYLQSARARAQRDGKPCKLEFDGTTIRPRSSAENHCFANSPRLPDLNLATVSGASGLTITGSTTNAITFTPAGTLADELYGLGGRDTWTRVVYLGADRTNLQRCVFIDLVSIRIGWRNAGQTTCTYTSG